MAHRSNTSRQPLKPSNSTQTLSNNAHRQQSSNLDLPGPSSRLPTTAAAMSYAVPPHRRRETYYGNTLALIQDGFSDKNGNVGSYTAPCDTFPGSASQTWLKEKQRRISTLTGMLQVNDYSWKAPATCQPAHMALSDYRPYKKLYDERKFAHSYPFVGSKAAKPIGFLDLPPELRNRCYHGWLVFHFAFEFLPRSDVVSRKERIQVYCAAKAKFVRQTAAARQLLRLNKQFNKEASEVFYGENEFRFTAILGWVWFRGFMKTIGHANSGRLRKVTVHVHWIGGSFDARNPWTNSFAKDIESGIANDDETFKPLDKYRKPGPAHRECIKILEEAGNLSELNLILPATSNIYTIKDLEFNTSKFKTPPTIRLVDLNEWERTEQSKRPLPKLGPRKMYRGEIKELGKLIEEFEGPKAYAKAQGWEFEVAPITPNGEYTIMGKDYNSEGEEFEEADEDDDDAGW